MFFASLRVLVLQVLLAPVMRVAAARRAAVQLQQRAQAALVAQALTAATVRQLALVQALARHSLPARVQRPVLEAVLVQLQRLRAGPLAKSPSPRSSSSKARTGRSTTRRRRGR